MKVRNDFFAGFGGETEALDRGMNACEKALAVDPNNAEALVWHGSGLYFQGGMALQNGDPAKGMELVGKGIQEMDRAVALEPDKVGVRIPRGELLFGIADANRHLGRDAKAREWFQRISKEMAGTVHGRRADTYLRTGTLASIRLAAPDATHSGNSPR